MGNTSNIILPPEMKPVEIIISQPSPRTTKSAWFSHFVPTGVLNFAPRSPRQEPTYVAAPRLEDLTFDQLEYRFIHDESSTFISIYTNPDFWQAYYEINYASTDCMLNRSVADTNGVTNYFAACATMHQRLGITTDATGRTVHSTFDVAMRCGADQYIKRRNFSVPHATERYVDWAIQSGNVECLKLLGYFCFGIPHMKRAQELGHYHMYLYLHQFLLEHNLLNRRYDNGSILFDICCVNDDVNSYHLIRIVQPEFYYTAIRFGAVRILRHLLTQPEIRGLQANLFPYAFSHNAPLDILECTLEIYPHKTVNIELSHCSLELLHVLYMQNRLDPAINYKDLEQKLEYKNRLRPLLDGSGSGIGPMLHLSSSLAITSNISGGMTSSGSGSPRRTSPSQTRMGSPRGGRRSPTVVNSHANSVITANLTVTEIPLSQETIDWLKRHYPSE